MKHISSLILTAAAMFLFASSSFADIPANPHFTPMSLMPRPFAASSTFDVAGVYWLPDYLGKNISRDSADNSGISKEKHCSDYGYQSACGSGQTGEYVFVTNTLSCYKNCRCTEDYKYTDSNCQPPYYLEGTACNDGSGNKYKDCKLDVEEACSGYTKECPDGWRLEDGNRCKYDEEYGTCCNMCKGYNYEMVSEGYVENGSCDGCNGKRYKIKEDPCDGYTTCEYGAAVGAKTCKSGNTVKYSDCKKKPQSCPTGSLNLDTYWCAGALKCWIK